MGMYCGIDGVVRNVAGTDSGIKGVVRHMHGGYAGVNGVMRSFLEVLDQIDHVEGFASEIIACKMVEENNGWYTERIGAGIDAVNSVGKVTIQNNGISFSCSQNERSVMAIFYFYIVFSDGHKEKFEKFYSNTMEPIQLNVSYFNRTEDYADNSLFGKPLTDAGSHTKDVSFDPANYPFAASSVGAICLYNKSQECSQTYNYATIGGRTFPVVLEVKT